MRRWTLISLVIAAGVGVVIGVVSLDSYRTARAVEWIASDEGSTREAGWEFLLTPDASGAVRGAALRERIEASLSNASDEALADGAKRLAGKWLWGWGSTPDELMWRVVEHPDANGRDVANWMRQVPVDAEVDRTIIVFERLIRDARAHVQRDAVDELLAWLGRDRLDLLDDVTAVPSDDFARVSLNIAREIRDGIPEAEVVRREPEELRAIACDRDADPEARLLALWMVDEIAEADALAVLDDVPALDERGSAARFALVAEQVLSRETAERVSREWLVDYDDGRKRAGALLAALLGEHRQLLRALLEREDHPPVRTTYRLALDAMGGLSLRDPEGFAHRVLRPEEGVVNAESVLGVLLRGRGMQPYLIWNESGLSMLSDVDLQMVMRRFYPALTEAPVTRHYGRVEFVVGKRRMGKRRSD